MSPFVELHKKENIIIPTIKGRMSLSMQKQGGFNPSSYCRKDTVILRHFPSSKKEGAILF